MRDPHELKQLQTGFEFLEGPVWSQAENGLIFSDIPAARTLIWSADDGVRVVREHNGKANGNALDREGRLLSCEHLTSRLVRWESEGHRTVLASHFDEHALNSPNDVIVSRNGTIFFTDPPFGRALADMGEIRDRELEFSGIYCLTTSGELRLVSKRCIEPNGLCLSSDESRLLVNDTASGEIIEFRLGWAHGVPTFDDGMIWAVIPGDETGSVDGMKFDRDGSLFCTGPGGIHVLDADARTIDVIRVPEKVGNFAWGDADAQTLYICASTSLFATRTRVAGLVDHG